MKRFVLMLAIGLVFIVGLSGNAFGLARPYDYQAIYLDPDDHTWGGEGSGGSPGTHRPTEDSSTTWVPGFMPIDLFFNAVLSGWWWPTSADTGAVSQSSDYTVPIQENSGANNSEANTNNKGN